MRFRSQSAFTLVELLVVVAIIALLIAILLPAIDRARLAARHAACLANIRQQNVALTGYYTSNNGRMPWVVKGSNQSTCEVWARGPYDVPSGFGLMVDQELFGQRPDSLYCPDAQVTSNWGGKPHGTNHDNMKRTLYQAVKNNNAALYRVDYALGWWDGGPTVNEFETGRGYGRHPIDSDAKARVWVADCFGAFPVLYEKISHRGVFMPYGLTDGSAHTISNWREHQPDSGGAGYYHKFNDRPGWGFWRYFGSDLGLN